MLTLLTNEISVTSAVLELWRNSLGEFHALRPKGDVLLKKDVAAFLHARRILDVSR
jgi:hypothetical protein